MVIGDQVKALRAQKNMSQGDVEERTGLSAVTFHE
jgi:transcriptional regulator with XRE-family HTH domain